MKNKRTNTLYENSNFGKWIEQKPKNVICDYDDYAVDMNGDRVTITFSIERGLK